MKKTTNKKTIAKKLMEKQKTSPKRIDNELKKIGKIKPSWI